MGTNDGGDFHGTQSNPYAAPTAPVRAWVAVHGLRKAERLTRLLAVIIDGMIVGIPMLGLAIAVPVFFAPAPGATSFEGIDTTLLVVLGAAFLLYVLGFSAYQIYWLWKNGQTLGKKLMKIRIVRNDGAPAELWRLLLLRFLVPGLIGAVPFVGGLFSLADPVFIFGEQKRCLHDLIADTIVVDA